MIFSGLKLQKYGAVSLLLEGLQPNKKQFNKGWYVVEFTAVTDDKNLNAPVDARFMYNIDGVPVYSTLMDEKISPVVSLDSNSENLFGNLQQYDRFNMPLFLPDIYEGYDIGCFVSDKYTTSFVDVFYRAFIYKLKFKAFYNMMVEEFSDYTVPIKIRTYDQPDTNWDQPTARLSALNSIGTIKETNPDISMTEGCITRQITLEDKPNKLSYSVASVKQGSEYNIKVIGDDGTACMATGKKNSAGIGEDAGTPCSKKSTIEICVYGDQSEINIDYIELTKGVNPLFREEFEGKTVIDKVVGGSCPNNYCDYTLGETPATCSDCYGICEASGYKPAGYNCPSNVPIAKSTPGCYEVKTKIGDSCVNDCHCGTILSETGVCNARGKCAPFTHSFDVYNEAKQKCGSIPANVDCFNYGRKSQVGSKIVYECLDLDKTTAASVEICRV